MFKKDSLASKILARINRSKAAVFVPSDFFDLSDYDQVGRVLRRLVKNNILLRLGQGVYAKARYSKISNGYVPEAGLIDVSKQALKKLGIKVLPSSYEKAYNKGLSSQVPTGLVIGVNKRVSRKISFNGNSVRYEKITQS